MADLNIGIITQARMTSTRLPGKILLPIKEKPVLQYHLERLQQSHIPIFIATTTNATDDPVFEFAAKTNTQVYRGDEKHVLSRYFECARQYGLEVIVRVTSDCPLIDGQLITEAVEVYKNHSNKKLYASNVIDRTYPRGFDFEIFSFDLLAEAFHHATLPEDLEHVTPFIHQNRSGQVEFLNFTRPADKSFYRITLDTTEDFTLIQKLILDFQADGLTANEIIHLLDMNPEIVAINAHIEQKK